MDTTTATTASPQQEPSLSSLITQALVWNNDGVSYLLHGKPEEGINLFKQSLTVLNYAVQHFPLWNNLSSSDWHHQSNNLLTDLCILSSSGTPFLSHTTTMDEDDDYQLFDSPIVLMRSPPPSLHECNNEEDHQDRSNLVFYSAAVMMNLALGFHQLGRMMPVMNVSSSSSSASVAAPSILWRADRLYQSILNLLMNQSHPTPASSSSSAFSFLALAAQNNRLAISLQLESSTSAFASVPSESASPIEIKEEMHAMISTMDNTSTTNSQYENKYIGEFCLNLMHLDMTCMRTNLAAPSA